MKNRCLLIVILIAFNATVSAQTIQAPNFGWPVNTSNSLQHRGRIAGSPSEYRSPYANGSTVFGSQIPNGSHRFHMGVDITSSDGADVTVYSIETLSHTIEIEGSGYNKRILINNTIYWHVQELAGYLDGVSMVSENEAFATIATTSDHVHMQPSMSTIAGALNFFNYKLPGYQDRTIPVINNNYFYANGYNKTTQGTELNAAVNIGGQDHTVIYNNIDIAIETDDEKVGSDGNAYGTGNLGPNSLAYRILDYRNEDVSNGYITSLDFTQLPTYAPALSVFGFQTTCCGPTVFRYVLTSSLIGPTYDRFWNSRLRTNQVENWDLTNRQNLDARICQEAVYPDGIYTFGFRIQDLDSDGPARANSSSTRNAKVVVDNFKPYVKKLLVSKTPDFTNLIYKGEWEFNSATGILALNSVRIKDALPTDPIYIQIVMSEPVTNVQINIPSVDGSLYRDLNTPLPNPTNNTVFITQYSAITAAGDQTIGIKAIDYAGNSLQSNPAILSVHQSDGGWSPSPSSSGIDKQHTFKTGSNSCTATGGRIATNGRISTSSCLFVDLGSDKSIMSTGEDVVFTPYISSNGPVSYNWSFGDGAVPASSTTSGAQNVVYSTSGLKTVSLKICNLNGECLTETKTNFISVDLVNELVVDFTTNKNGGNVNENIQLTAAVTGAVGELSYMWDFGEGIDGNQLANANPLISYSTPGNKTIRLTVTDGNGSVTKVKNNYIQINSNAFNIVPTITGCGTTDPSGNINLNSFVTGGNNDPGDDRYLWDFGDGKTSTATAISVTHKYSKFGKYTVRLTVCDATSCGTAVENTCVNVPGNIDNDPLQPDFLVNDQTLVGPMQTVGLNTPLKFTSSTTGGGAPTNFKYRWIFDFQIQGGANGTSAVPFATSLDLGHPVEEVYYTTTGNKAVVLEVDNGSVAHVSPIREVVKIQAGLGSGTCYAKIGNATISSTCWSPTSIPQFTVPVLESNCPVAKTEVMYNNNVLPNNRLDFAAIGQAVPDFPFTADFQFAVYQFDGISYNPIGYKRQRFTIYGPVTVGAGADLNVCLGASTQPQATGNGNSSFQWSSTDQNAMSFLSSSTQLNPVFTGIQKGSYTYKIKATDLSSGCVSSFDDVMIAVDRPEIGDKSFFPGLSENINLNLSTSGGFGSNVYSWTPGTNLTASNILAPNFLSSVQGDYYYNVKVTDQLGCTSNANIYVNAANAPGNLATTPEAFNRVSLLWVDRSNIETQYVVLRSVNGGPYQAYATLNANSQSFDDLNVSQGNTYAYQIVAVVNGNYEQVSNQSVVSTTDLPLFTYIPGTADAYADFDNDGDFDYVSIKGGSPRYMELYLNNHGTYTLSNATNLTVGGSAPYRFILADFDNDNDIDVYIYPLFSSVTSYSNLLINNSASFSVVNPNLNAFADTKIALFDYQNDNDVDLTQIDGADQKTRIFLSNGSAPFTNILTDLTLFNQPSSGASKGDYFGFADVDNDGDQDLAAPVGNNLFVFRYGNGLTDANKQSVFSTCCNGDGSAGLDFADFNNDQKIDIIQTGKSSSGQLSTTLLKNEGNFTFTDVLDSSIPDLYYGTVKWGDMESDGDLDFFISGSTASGNTTGLHREIYQNNNGTFNLVHTSGGSIKDWVDYDNDGDLDLILLSNGILRNNNMDNRDKINTAPTSPENLCLYVNGNEAVFSWGSSSDQETPAPGLTYNLYVKYNDSFVMTPLSDINTGFRKIQRKGNVDQNLSWKLTLPGTGKIEWGIQSVDSQFRGSRFATYVANFAAGTVLSDGALCGTYPNTVWLNAPHISSPANCQSNAVFVSETANMTLKASVSVDLLPGTTIKQGAHFRAYVNQSANIPCVPGASSRQETPTEIKDVSREAIDKFEVYPNPSKGIFNIAIKFSAYQEHVVIEVITPTGITIHHKEYHNIESIEDQIDLNEFVNGIFFIRKKDGSGVATMKILKL
jgi:PKD repeat protein